MTQHDIFNAIGEISDEFIYEAAPKTSKKKSGIILRFTAAAACIAAVAGGVFMLNALKNGKPVVYTPQADNNVLTENIGSEGEDLAIGSESDTQNVSHIGIGEVEDITEIEPANYYNRISKNFYKSSAPVFTESDTLPDYFPTIGITELDENYAGLVQPIEDTANIDRDVLYIATAKGFDRNTDEMCDKKVFLHKINGFSPEFAVAAQFENDDDYYAYINFSSQYINDFLGEISGNITFSGQLDTYDNENVNDNGDESSGVYSKSIYSCYPSTVSDVVRDIIFPQVNENKLTNESFMDNDPRVSFYDNKYYSVCFCLDDINMPVELLFNDNGVVILDLQSAKYFAYIRPESIEKCLDILYNDERQ